ncbi:MAG: hypothetical protein AMXMBFR7_27970 [Planctomycetota bacterium]
MRTFATRAITGIEREAREELQCVRDTPSGTGCERLQCRGCPFLKVTRKDEA